MTVALIRAYQGFPAGAVVDLPAENEAALVAQGLASTSAAAITPGAQTNLAALNPWQPVTSGYVSVAIGATSVAITIPGVTTQHKASAVIAQAAADSTFVTILRVNCTLNTVTITGTAAATAATRLAYWVTT